MAGASIPQSLTVPTVSLQAVLRRVREAQAPLVRWSESKAQMDAAAFQRLREEIEEIEKQLADLLGPDIARDA